MVAALVCGVVLFMSDEVTEPQVLPSITGIASTASVSNLQPTPTPIETNSQAHCSGMNYSHWRVEEQDISRICASYGERMRPAGQRLPKIFYSIMFGIEVDMLEVVLHEIFPVVDHIFITESTVTHSLRPKGLVFHKIAKTPRFAPFLSKISHDVFSPTKRYSSGWDVEKRQRSFFLRRIAQYNISAGDIVVGNTDLDELFSRELLLRYKYCDVGEDLNFHVFHFRYNFNCLQELQYSRYGATVFLFPNNTAEMRKIDLYRRRTYRKAIPFDVHGVDDVMTQRLVWHMSAFGGVDAVQKKYENSPHRFVGELSRDAIRASIEACTYNGAARFRVRLPVHRLPYFVRLNLCHYVNLGWF